MTAIPRVKKVEIFQPEYTLLFKPSIVGNFLREKVEINVTSKHLV